MSVIAEDFSEQVTSISSVNVQLGDIVSESGTLVIGDNASIAVEGLTRDAEEEAEITDLVNISSSQPAIATVSNNGDITFNGALGEVTFTISSGDLTEIVTLNVVSEARSISVDDSSISESALSIAAGEDAEVEVELLDQFGDAVQGAIFTLENPDEEQGLVDITGQTVDSETGVYTVTLTAGDTAGEGEVTLSANETDLGTVDVTVQEAGDAVSYEVTVENNELDLNGVTTTTLALTGYDEVGLATGPQALSDVTRETAEDGQFYAVSSDEDVVTVANGNQLTGESEGTATITIYQRNGAFHDEVASIDVTVVDSTPVISDVTFSDLTEITEEGSFTIDGDIIESLTAVDPEGNDAGVTYATEWTGDDNNELAIYEEVEGKTGNRIGTVLVTPNANISFNDVDADNSASIGLDSDSPEAVNISVLNHNRNVVASTTLTVSIEEAPADGGEGENPDTEE